MMSPVHVEDVAAAFVNSLDDDKTIGKTFALGGPEAVSWTDMIRRIAEAVGRAKWVLPYPIWLIRIGATLFDWLPFFPATRDQLTMLAEGNTADPAIIEQLIGRPFLLIFIGRILFFKSPAKRRQAFCKCRLI